MQHDSGSGELNALNAVVEYDMMNGIGGGLTYEIDVGLTGTVVFEATVDGTNWFAIKAVRISDRVIISNETSFAARGFLTSVLYRRVRLRVSVYSSGSSNARLLGYEGAGIQPTFLNDPAPAVPQDLNKTVSATGTPEALAPSETFFLSLTITGNSAAQTANTSTAYLGTTASQDIPIAPGENIAITAPEGKRMDLQDWFLRVGTNDDGVRGQYVN